MKKIIEDGKVVVPKVDGEEKIEKGLEHATKTYVGATILGVIVFIIFCIILINAFSTFRLPGW